MQLVTIYIVINKADSVLLSTYLGIGLFRDDLGSYLSRPNVHKSPNSNHLNPPKTQGNPALPERYLAEISNS